MERIWRFGPAVFDALEASPNCTLGSTFYVQQWRTSACDPRSLIRDLCSGEAEARASPASDHTKVNTRPPFCVIKLDLDDSAVEEVFLSWLLAEVQQTGPQMNIEFFWEPHTHTMFNLNMQLLGQQVDAQSKVVVDDVDGGSTSTSRQGKREGRSDRPRLGDFSRAYRWLLALRKGGVRAHGWV